MHKEMSFGQTDLLECLTAAFPRTGAKAELRADTRDAQLDKIIESYFNGQEWQDVHFPPECESMLEAFTFLNPPSQAYYLPAYILETQVNVFYLSGCLSVLNNEELLSYLSVSQKSCVRKFIVYCLANLESGSGEGVARLYERSLLEAIKEKL